MLISNLILFDLSRTNFLNRSKENNINASVLWTKPSITVIFLFNKKAIIRT